MSKHSKFPGQKRAVLKRLRRSNHIPSNKAAELTDLWNAKAAERAMDPLPERLWTWMRDRTEGVQKQRGLKGKDLGIDMLEPRLLMSADPVTTAAATLTSNTAFTKP